MSTHQHDNSSDVDIADLNKEVVAAIPGKAFRLNYNPATITFTFDDTLSSGEESTLENTVINHKAASSTRSLANNKKSRKEEIDLRTMDLIKEGFVHSSKTFSLSQNAQSKWHGMHNDRANLTYPVVILTADETDEVSLADSAAVESFYSDMVGTVRGHIDGGADLKKQIRDAVDQAAVDAVVDNR